MNIALWLSYALSPVLINWVYMHIALQVNDTGERLFFITDTIGIDPTLPIIGIMFFVRDIIQQRMGRLIAIIGIVLGTICSAAVSPEVALASGSAFLFSESVDMITYTMLHDKNPIVAVLVSGLFASFVDTFTFLLVAFGTTDTWDSQVFGKIITTVLCSVGYYVWQKNR